jgi:pyruvate dehydrogenase E1 component alpha subunit
MQVLDEHGNVDAELEPKLDESELIRLYRAMVLARQADQRMLNLQRQGRVGTFGPSTGQEATPCGAVLAMTDQDWFVGSFREIGGHLMRGLPLWAYYLFHKGYEEGNLRLEGASHRTLPISIIVGSQTLHAVGLAYAMKYRKQKDSAAVTFFGDGATSEGDVYEAMNFASVWQVPAVFICQNNQWAISISRKHQTRSATLAQKAIACEMPTIQVDGNDALAVYKATKTALERAHAGKGPSFIEAVTYRLLMHTTADDPTKYRPEEEVEEAWKREPLIRFRKYLEKKCKWNDDKQSAMEEGIRQEIDESVKELESRTEFRPDVGFDHVFGTRHAIIEQQRAEFLANLEQETADA